MGQKKALAAASVSNVAKTQKAKVQTPYTFQGYVPGQTAEAPHGSPAAVLDKLTPSNPINALSNLKDSVSSYPDQGSKKAISSSKESDKLLTTSDNINAGVILEEKSNGEASFTGPGDLSQPAKIPPHNLTIDVSKVSDLHVHVSAKKNSLSSNTCTSTVQLPPIGSVSQNVPYGSVWRETTEVRLQKLSTAQTEDKSLCVPDKLFLQWENSDALCWLDVVLCLLTQSKSVRKTIALTSPQTGRARKGFLVRTLFEAYDQAMRLSKYVRSQKNNVHKVSRNSTDSGDKVKQTTTQNGFAGCHSVNSLSDNNYIQNNPNKSLGPLSTPKGVQLKMGAGQTQSCLLPSEATLAELMACNADFLKARAILSMVRELVFKELQPKLRCEKGRKDSPVFAIPLLLHSDPDISHLFKTMYKFETRCNKCGNARIERYSKVLPTLPKVAPDFSMKNVSHHRDCFTCRAPNQKRQLQFESLAHCVMIHFVEGLPSSDLNSLDFTLAGQSFSVSAVVQYKCDPSHFVIWIKHPSVDCWMECDDLKGPLCRYTHTQPNIPAAQIHIVFWERVSSNVIPPTTTTNATTMASATTTPPNSIQNMVVSPLTLTATGQSCLASDNITRDPTKVTTENTLKSTDRKENCKQTSSLSFGSGKHSVVSEKEKAKDNPPAKCGSDSVKKKEPVTAPKVELKPKAPILRKTFSILKQMKSNKTSSTSMEKCPSTIPLKSSGRKTKITPSTTSTTGNKLEKASNTDQQIGNVSPVGSISERTTPAAKSTPEVLGKHDGVVGFGKRKFFGTVAFEGYKSKKTLHGAAVSAISDSSTDKNPRNTGTMKCPPDTQASDVSSDKTAQLNVHKFSVPLSPAKRKRANVSAASNNRKVGKSKTASRMIFPTVCVNTTKLSLNRSPDVCRDSNGTAVKDSSVFNLNGCGIVSGDLNTPGEISDTELVDDFDLAALGFCDIEQTNSASKFTGPAEISAAAVPCEELIKGNNSPEKGSICHAVSQTTVLRDLYKALNLNVESDAGKQSDDIQTFSQLSDEIFG